MPNRLASERSPYLLQHANNPVDWYPWGEAAFERARREDKPIFLSIGYSTCHWCHVMERESFENERVAERLNRDFVSIKVDREERPDVDRVYMTFVQATTGSGGWPMSVWLTPDLKPFYGGTYFPPTSRWGRAGFMDVLADIAETWRRDRERVTRSADSLLGHIGRAVGTQRSTSAPASWTPDALDAGLRAGVDQYAGSFDRRRGGFGGAPKFPRPSELLFLLREWARTKREDALDMSLGTLRAMALGGMRDHVGGGFHRYSVDAEWRVPHFEKMLYDQAQLALAFLEAAQASGDDLYALVAIDTLDYVARDMTDPGGGFYSAEDADSVPPEAAADAKAEKMEGAFYLWTDREIADLMGPDADIVRFRFGLEPDGNAPFDPQNEFKGKNLLYIARSIEDVAARTGRTVDEVKGVLGPARRRMFEARAGRPRPHLDDKILAGWNGLMIGAFARAARLRPGFPDGGGSSAGALRQAARRAASFVRETLWDPARARLLRRYRDGEASIDAYCEDYAQLVFGLIELFQADPDPQWLDWAITLQRRQDELFWDAEEGGWFSTTGTDPSVLLRLKEQYDGAEPSATSVSLLNLLALASWTNDPGFIDRMERVVSGWAPRAAELARVVPLGLAGCSMYLAGMTEIVLVGRAEAPETVEMRRTLARWYLPAAVTLALEPDGSRPQLAALLPFVSGMGPRDGRTAAYVCRGQTCQEPCTEAGSLERQLARL